MARSCDNFAKEKWKQYIIENSSEIKELRRQLQTAYNRHMLEAIEKRIAEQNEQLFEKEERRLKEEEAKYQHYKLHFGNELQMQMREKQQRHSNEETESILQAKEVEQRIQNEILQDQRKAEELRLRKIQLREDQKKFCELQHTLKDYESVQMREVEKHLLQQVNQLAIRDAEQTLKRKQQLALAEEKKSILIAKLEKQSKMRKEEEDLAIRLMCAVKEKQEQERYEESLRLEAVKHESLKQKYEDIIRDKVEEQAELKQSDREYAEYTRRKIEESVEVDVKIEKEKRRLRTAVRKDNGLLIEVKAAKKKADIQTERSVESLIQAEETARLDIVNEERLRLLKCLDRPILDQLPRGCLGEEDLLALNYQKI